jgi:hypothetical protein
MTIEARLSTTGGGWHCERGELVPDEVNFSDAEGREFGWLQFQNGPVGEVGVNGIQQEDLIQVVIARLEALNELLSCEENGAALYHLRAALGALEDRTRRRQAQGVEGRNVAHAS